MLIIRSEQKDSFREAARKGFETEMLTHLRKFSPALFQAAGEEQMFKAVQLGIESAESYGFTFRGPIRLYLELMLLFGSRFDTDPQYPWAIEILNDRASALQMRRADLLYEKTLDYREKVAGPDDAYTLEAYRKIAIRDQQPLNISSEDLAYTMQREIERLYPQKAAYVGEAGLEALILEGIKEARLHGFSAARGVMVIIMLMLALGHGCTDDPLYPWIARTLKNEAITDPEARAGRLEKRALIWLDNVLAYFEKGAQT